MIQKGVTHEVPYPFVRDKANLLTEEGFAEVESWRPGTRAEVCGPEEAQEVADGEGVMILNVVDVHKPGRYPTRVFFTRLWRDPDGKVFGRSGLHIMTEQAFKRRLRGFMHPYEVHQGEQA